MWINLNQSLSSSFDDGGVGGVYRKCSWPDGLMALDEKFDPRSSRAMPVWWESNTFAEVTSQTHDHNLCHDINTWMSSYCCGILAWVKKPKRLTFLTSTSTTYSKIQNGFSAIHHSVVVVFCRSFGCLCLITAESGCRASSLWQASECDCVQMLPSFFFLLYFLSHY